MIYTNLHLKCEVTFLYFHQVVGGIVWCLEMCAEDVDVNFLFRENLNIGEKLQVYNLILL